MNDAPVTVPPLSMTASLVTFARLIATPAPTLMPEPTVEAEPSAFAFASVLADDASVTAPAARDVHAGRARTRATSCSRC